MSVVNISKKKKEQELKRLVFSKYFKSGQHKKVIMEAARKSAEDQKALSKQYDKMFVKAS